jgi:translation elongation factor EF-1alpha
MMEGEERQKVPVGKIAHFYDKISVAVVELSDTLKQGDEISIEGHGNEVKQKVDSMQIEHQTIPQATKGQSIGLKTAGAVKEGDLVYKLV